jgi:hypothetical protein
MPKRIAVIDADTALYAEAARAEVRAGESWLPLMSVDRVYANVEARLEEQMDDIECDDAIVTLTSPTNFRKTILPTYKQNRSGLHKPILLPALRAKVQERNRWPVLVVATLEADDVCGISAGQLMKQGRDAIIISPDKDLRQIPGLYWNPTPSRAGNKREVETITEGDGDRFHLMQTLTGDAVDNYKGLPGCGPVKALSILNALEDASAGERWGGILAEYHTRGYTTEYALTQARVARILRFTEWDSKKKRPVLWVPPSP